MNSVTTLPLNPQGGSRTKIDRLMDGAQCDCLALSRDFTASE